MLSSDALKQKKRERPTTGARLRQKIFPASMPSEAAIAATGKKKPKATQPGSRKPSWRLLLHPCATAQSNTVNKKTTPQALIFHLKHILQKSFYYCTLIHEFAPCSKTFFYFSLQFFDKNRALNCFIHQ